MLMHRDTVNKMRPRSFSLGSLSSNQLKENDIPPKSFFNSLLIDCYPELEYQKTKGFICRSLKHEWKPSDQRNKNKIISWTMDKAKLVAKIRYLKIVPGFLLMVAVLVASSNLWFNNARLPTLLSGAGTLAVSAVVIYTEYFHAITDNGAAASISHLWWGLLFGLLAFGVDFYRSWAYDDRDRLMDMLLMTSTALKCCCDFLDRFCKDVHYRSVFLLQTEVGSLIGFLFGGVLFLEPQSDMDLLLIISASSFVIINLRMKCPLAFLYIFLFIGISGVSVFGNLGHTINAYALVCYHVRLFFPTSVDFYFSPLSALERWSCSFDLSRCKQFFLLLSFFSIESLFCGLAFYAILLHPEYELVFVIPVVTVAGLVWLCTHFAFMSTEITLSNKLAECQEFYHKLPTTSGGTSLPHIMSSKGVRLLCLVGQQTIACALLASFVFGAISWRREDASYPAILLIVIGLECASFGRIRELAVKLGGTCASYALITPTTAANTNVPITILPPDSLQKQNERATSLITAMHRFFALYLIDTLGCDYSKSGMTFNTVEEKLKNLFSKRTKEGSGDGARYDTYLFYYSGLTSEDGSFVLGDGAILTPEHILNLWRESCCDDSDTMTSRLLLVFDVAASDPWFKVIKSLKHELVALQSCGTVPLQQKRDIEEGLVQSPHQPGSFTAKWVQWNYDVGSGVYPTSSSWFDGDTNEGMLRPMYAVSRRWTDFAVRVPTSSDGDLANHWKIHYSFLCRPCLKTAASCSGRLNLVRLLSAPGCRYRRFKMRWFPPSVLDTGHGFKLLRS